MSAGKIDELSWLAEPWARAAHALQSDRVPAGLLILGRPGLGRARLAGAIARALLCLDPGADAQACGRCAACREMNGGAHPDCLEVRILENKTQILVEQIRELTRGLSLTAGEKGARCAIISPAEKLSTTGANALLKTLEEPPRGTTLILIADSVAHLLPTITSRCLRLAVPRPAPEQALAWLNSRHERADWPLLLALAGGAPLAAEALAEEPVGSLGDGLERLLAAAAGRGDPVAAANEFSQWTIARFGALLAWLAWTVLRVAETGTSAPAASRWSREIAALAARADARRLAAVWLEAGRSAGDGAWANPALARERLILLFVSAFPNNRNTG